MSDRNSEMSCLSGEAADVRGIIEEARELKALADEKLRRLDLEQLRKRAKLSQEKAARIADVSTKTWFRWERRQSTPRPDALERVCRYVERNQAA